MTYGTQFIYFSFFCGDATKFPILYLNLTVKIWKGFSVVVFAFYFLSLIFPVSDGVRINAPILLPLPFSPLMLQHGLVPEVLRLFPKYKRGDCSVLRKYTSSYRLLLPRILSQPIGFVQFPRLQLLRNIFFLNCDGTTLSVLVRSHAKTSAVWRNKNKYFISNVRLSQISRKSFAAVVIQINTILKHTRALFRLAENNCPGFD